MDTLWGRVLTGGRELGPSRVELADGRIVGLEPAEAPRPRDVEVAVELALAKGLDPARPRGLGKVTSTL